MGRGEVCGSRTAISLRGKINTYISLLRGINVSGQKKILMANLRALYETLGFANVQTYVQSGNVIFTSEAADQPGELAMRIQSGINARYGFEVPVFIYTPADFARILAANPFPQADRARLMVTFLAGPLPLPETLSIPASGRDEYVFGEQEIYIHCPDGFGNSKLSNNLWEQKLKRTATTRNWNTVSALYRMAG